mgnify:CR=1 FL=1
MAKGWLVVISGPSGVGKTTVAKRLCSQPSFVRVMTATTRPPRSNETNGRDYDFLSRERFEEGIAKGEFLEHATIFGNLYGTPKKSIEGAIAAGKRVVVDIDSQGARSMRALGLPAVLVFIVPPSLEELKRRLEGRNTEGETSLRRRLEAAQAEIARSGEYDVVVTNRTVEQTVTDIEDELKKRAIL